MTKETAINGISRIEIIVENIMMCIFTGDRL
jgi:hypothetical protein